MIPYFISISHFTCLLNHCVPAFFPSLCFSGCKVNLVSLSSRFCCCCLTRSPKLNTRSGCPLYNLASNSKDFHESVAKLLGMIFLYFGTPLTCCRYLFSFFNGIITFTTSVDSFWILLLKVCQNEMMLHLCYTKQPAHTVLSYIWNAITIWTRVISYNVYCCWVHWRKKDLISNF